MGVQQQDYDDQGFFDPNKQYQRKSIGRGKENNNYDLR